MTNVSLLTVKNNVIPIFVTDRATNRFSDANFVLNLHHRYSEISYHEVTDSAALYKSLKNDCEPPVMFAINRNLYAYVKITNREYHLP